MVTSDVGGGRKKGAEYFWRCGEITMLMVTVMWVKEDGGSDVGGGRKL